MAYKEVVERVRATYRTGRTLSVEYRKEQLRRLLRMYEDHEEDFIQAIQTDLRKPRLEAVLMESFSVKEDIQYILRRLDKWAQTQEVPSKIPLDKSYVYNEPYGVVLVMGAWNFPLQLTMLPVAGAIAAGNCVIIKPSEVSSATAAAIAKFVPNYLDKDCYSVVCGGVAETTDLLKERFDYIFYTGSPMVGKIVRDAANKNLTPTTLELGGKSPCYIDNTADLDMAVKRILWGKCVNLGQICIAPDYLLCSKGLQDTLVEKMKAVLKEWYGDDPEKSPDLSRIVAERHVKRLASYLDSGKVVVGGKYNVEKKWMEPTILVDVKEDSKIMTEEIFGPILPIINVESHVEAMRFINKREKPLALYVFTKSKARLEMFMREVPCGGATLNDTIFHVGNPELPFGGVGNSGMGAYHGKHTYDTFTHKKSCLQRNYIGFVDKIMQFRFPPYTEHKLKMITNQRDGGDGPGVLHYLKIVLSHVVAMGVGALILYLALHYSNARI